MALKPICVPCQRFYRPHKNGRYFIEGMPDRNDAPPGTVAPEMWRPYKLWQGDEWLCESCGSKIIVGVGREPLSEHYRVDFEEWVRGTGAVFQVNDC